MKKILVIQNKRIGDVLISSVIATNIKKVFPNCHVSYFVYDYTVGVLENNPYIDQIIPINEKALKKIPNLIKTIVALRKENYDIIFDPYAKFQSRMICLFSGAPYRIGLKRAHKKLKLPFYTHPINLLSKKTTIYGKAIEDRVNMVSRVFPLEGADFTPRIYLSEEEKTTGRLAHLQRPIIMVGILGSTGPKSLPKDYMVALINHITQTYQGTLLFNYAPYQKKEAKAIYEACSQKEAIDFSIYEEDIRGYVQLMHQADFLIANEGGSVHIAKALDTPTYTIYSPYIDKEHWNSFEDGITHDSIHLREERPDLFSVFTHKERQKIEENPETLYRALTPEMIIRKMDVFLDRHLKRKNQ